MQKGKDKDSSVQVHIISAGSGMNETFKTALKNYSIDSVVVFQESNEEETSSKEDKREIDLAIEKLRGTARELDIKFDLKRVRTNDMNDARDKVLAITREYRNGRFFFNLTHGRKLLPLYLLVMALWIDGIAYYIDRSQKVIEINMPRMHAEEVLSNRNLFNILQILFKSSSNSDPWLKYRDVYAEISESYVSDRQGKGGRRKRLGMGTFSRWVRRLIDSGLIEERFEDGSQKQKLLKLTGDGEFSYMIYKNQLNIAEQDPNRGGS